MPVGPVSADTSTGKSLHEHLGQEDVAIFVPVEDLKALTGSYRHMRAAAHVICSAQLKGPLPPAWNDLHESDLKDAGGKPFKQFPWKFRTIMAFTQVSFSDPNVDAKVFVRQHPYGTGSFRSTLDCLENRAIFRLHRFWSYDGVFLDTVDPEWMFWQREAEYKWRLFSDYRGRHVHKDGEANAGGNPASGRELYSQQRLSHRIGTLIPESSQALTRKRYDWLEMAREGNLGAPTAMTTVVANVQTSSILAHVRRGPCAMPDPEDTIGFLKMSTGMYGLSPEKSSNTLESGGASAGAPTDVVPTKTSRVSIMTNAGIQTADYLRRRREFESYAYRNGYDSIRGRIPDRCRRREHQKRGFNHDHYNEFAERCGLPSCHWAAGCSASVSADVQGSPAADTTAPVPTATALPRQERCRSVSRWCLRAGVHCQLPPHTDGCEYHSANHNAYATAELCRPFPLGTISHGAPMPPKLAGSSLADTFAALGEDFWSSGRLHKHAEPRTDLHCLGNFLERLHEVCAVKDLQKQRSTGDGMSFEDLMEAYYYRSLQTAQILHVCRLGYCERWARYPNG